MQSLLTTVPRMRQMKYTTESTARQMLSYIFLRLQALYRRISGVPNIEMIMSF